MIDDSNELVNVSNYDDPKDYINSDGLNKCYDVGLNEYAVSLENEDLFASFPSSARAFP